MGGFYDEVIAANGVYKFYSDGEWKETTSSRTVKILNPSTNEPVYQVQGQSRSDRQTRMILVLPAVWDDPQVLFAPKADCCGRSAAACTRDEVDTIFDAAKAAQPGWAKTPLWKRADYMHKVAALMKENAQPMADALVKEIAKPAKDALTGLTSHTQNNPEFVMETHLSCMVPCICWCHQACLSS